MRSRALLARDGGDAGRRAGGPLVDAQRLGDGRGIAVIGTVQKHLAIRAAMLPGSTHGDDRARLPADSLKDKPAKDVSRKGRGLDVEVGAGPR